MSTEKEFKVGDLVICYCGPPPPIWSVVGFLEQHVMLARPGYEWKVLQAKENIRHLTEEEKMKYDVYGAMEATDKLAAKLHLAQSEEGKWQWVDGDTDTTEYLDSCNKMPVDDSVWQEKPEIDIQDITRQIARQYS